MSNNPLLPAVETEGDDVVENPLLKFVEDKEFKDKNILNESFNHNPDQAAKAVAFGTRTGMGFDYANKNLDEIEKRERSDKVNEKLKDAPATKAFMAHPDNARISHDDVDNLNFFEKHIFAPLLPIVETVEESFERGQITTKRGFIGTALQKTGNNEYSRQLKALDDRLVALGPEPEKGFTSFVSEATKILAQQYEAFKSPEAAAFIGGGIGVGATVGAFGGPLAPATAAAGGIAGLAAGTISFAFKSSSIIEGGNHYADLIEQGVDSQTASDHATWVGILNGAMEIAPVSIVAGPFKNLLKKSIMDSAEKALLRPTIKRAALTFGKTYGAGILAESSTEVLQEITNIISEETAKASSGLQAIDLTNPTEADQEELINRLEDIFVKTAKGMALLGPIGPGLNLRSDFILAKNAKKNEQIIEAMGESARASKVRERLPDKYKEFVEKVREQGPVKDIQIPADKFVEYFQSKGIDPAQAAREISLDVEQQLPEAMGIGGDIIIPLQDYQTHVAGTEHHAGLSRDLRLQSGDMTLREAEAFEAQMNEADKKLFEEFGVQAEVDAKEVSTFENIKTKTKQQLLDAGQTENVAEQQATLSAARAVTRAKRLGRDPLELIEERPVQIRSEVLERLREKPVDEFDLLIDRARTGRVVPEKEVRGKSLFDFLREKGGLQDAGGELAAREIPTRPGQRKLIQEAGLSLDDAAQMAQEAGYFPEGERPTINDLLDAIDREARGEPVFVEGREDIEEIQTQENIEELNRLLGEAGIDLQTATNEEVRAALGAELEARPVIEGREGRTVVDQKLFQKETDEQIKLQKAKQDDILNIKRDIQKLKEGNYVPEQIPASAKEGIESASVGPALDFLRGFHEEYSEVLIDREVRNTPTDAEQSQREKIKSDEAAALKEWAQENNLWRDSTAFYSQWNQQGNLGGSEHLVVLSPDGKSVRKVATARMNATLHEYLSRLAIHNYYFPESSYRFIGMSENKEGNPVIMVEQQGVDMSDNSLIKPNFKTEGQSPRELRAKAHEELKKMGFKEKTFSDYKNRIEGKALTFHYFVNDEGVVIYDLHHENVIHRPDGTIEFIDPVIIFDPSTQLERLQAQLDEREDIGFEVDADLAGLADDLGIELFQGNVQAVPGPGPKLVDLVDRPSKDLFVAHNLTAAGILAAEKLGGLAAPSIAIARSGVSDFTGFGEITLLADKELLDSPKTRTFDADIYSPRQPRAVYKIDHSAYNNLIDILDESRGELILDNPDFSTLEEGNGADAFLRSVSAKYHWLKEKGIAPKLKDKKVDSAIKKAAKLELNEFEATQDKRFIKIATEHYQKKLDSTIERAPEMTEKFTEMYFEDNGTLRIDKLRDFAVEMRRFRDSGGKDTYQLRDDINKKMRSKKLQDEFSAWAEVEFNKLVTGKQLFKGFTPSGNRKYVEYNMLNVLKEMTSKLQGGESYFYGAGSIRSVYAKEFKNIKQVQAKRDNIVSESDMNKIKEDSQNVLLDVLEKLKPFYKFDADNFGYMDDAGTAIMEGPRGLREAFDVNEEVHDLVNGLISYLSALPTSYFEAKIQRAVRFDEFNTAVVPNDIDKRALEILEINGLKIKKYDPKRKESRAEVIAKQNKLFFQGKPKPQRQDKVRGSIQFTDTETIINLFKNADLSTYLHESGHLYINELADDAALADAPQQIKDDFQTLLNFVGAETAEDLDISLHGDAAIEKQETLARAFEAYLREGKAPSVELQTAFQNFKAWLISIYRTIKNLNVEISDELRGVFDRMIATDEEIELAEKQAKYQPVFTTAEAGGMTAAEFNKYNESAKQATESAKDDLLKEALKEVTRERRKWWKEERAKTRGQVEAEINEMPVYQSIHFLTTGEFLVGEMPEGLEPLRLSRQMLVNQYGKEILKRLPKGKQAVYSSEDGVHPRVIADLFGFSSGDELIQAMLKAQPRNKAIENETDVRMKQEHGDMLNDGTIEEEAANSIHGDKRADFIRTELRALSKKTGIEVLPKKVIKDAAKRIIAEKRVRDINLGQYRRSEVKAADGAARAVADGDFVLATEEKRKQLLNHELFIEASKAKSEIDSTVRYMNKFKKPGTRANIETDYLDQIDALLERYDFKKATTLRDIERRKALNKWITEQEEEGNQVVIDEKLRNESVKRSYKDLPVEELRGLKDAIKNIEHIGRLKEKLLVAMEKRNLQEVANEVADSILANNKVHEIKPDFAPGFLKNFKKGVDRFHAAHLKMEFIFEKLDGFKKLGSTWEALFAPIAEAETFEQKKMEGIIKELNKKFNAYTRIERAGWSLQKTFVEEVGQSFNKQAILSLALNWGNEGNREAIKDGYGWTDDQVNAILANMDKRDWETVQGIWDLVDSLWPEISELQKDLTGVVPEKVERTPFKNDHGDWAGGYYPLKYDPEQSHTAYKRDEKIKSEDLFESNWLRPHTKNGHTIERVGSAGQKVKLDLSVITEHITNVVHDLAYRRAIIDVDRLSQQPQIKDAIESTAGKEVYRLVRPWLQSIANDFREPAGALEGWLGRARVGATVVNMGYKVTTAIVQPLGYLQSIDLIGEKWAAKGLGDFFRHPKKSLDFALERSVMMQNRQKTFDRDVRDALKKTTLRGPLFEVQQSFFYFTGLMDMTVAVPTWMGAYKKGLDEFDNDERRAIQAADQAVRMSQSAGGAKDLAQIQRGSEYHRIFTMFYSYFNVLYNLFNRRVGAEKKAGFSRKTIPALAASMMYLWFAPAIMSELIAQRGPDDDEEYPEWAAKNLASYPFQTVVGVRDVANAMFSDYGYSMTPAADAFESIAKLGMIPSKLAADEDIEKADVKAALLAAGYWGQLPSRQMWITGETLYDWATGEDEPEGIVDGVRDLLFARRDR